MQNLWNTEDQKVTLMVKNYILSGHDLARKYPNRRLYINIDWYKDGIGAMLLQEYFLEEARKSETQEKDSRKL